MYTKEYGYAAIIFHLQKLKFNIIFMCYTVFFLVNVLNIQKWKSS